MKILSIETSCDETAIALLDINGPLERPNIKILGNSLFSQVAIHEQYGGVYPMLAKREHQKNLPVLLEKTLKEAQIDTQCPPIDFIAVTAGPGLEPALWTGITFAEELGERWKKPVVPVNHMEGHIFSVLYGLAKDNPLRLPALALLVSGGHTELVHIKDFDQYEIIGHTVDDAVGEAFDKVARMLGLPYPGGPKISALAEKSRFRIKDLGFKFPRPMIHSGNLNFSFSGLKTAVLYKLRAENRDDDEFKENMARAFEDAAIDVLVKKTQTAIESLEGKIHTLIVGGGVAANAYLNQKLNDFIKDFPEITLCLPERPLTTDNAVMIGIAAYVNITTNPTLLNNTNKIVANGNLKVSSR
ncbi:MAG: tRNA (adenosine(37)-N6)-threonylcarbamoyltransferase complex transferase subunit TsaD [Candidatus Zambryskibacteria bacterium]|nr:tRNA (adenosine(37)-N6)-threonylcarbamoyltransferase complex transferase subunit TsaD [Candidatus Zambryskibacteria bacterium]